MSEHLEMLCALPSGATCGGRSGARFHLLIPSLPTGPIMAVRQAGRQAALPTHHFAEGLYLLH